MRAVLVSIAVLQVYRWGERNSGRRARGLSHGLGGRLSSAFFVRRIHQRDAAAMPKELGQLRKIAVPEREHVVFALEHDGLPPAIFQRLVSDHEMARPDLVPGSRKAPGVGEAVLAV